jgi:hypothetical protein
MPRKTILSTDDLRVLCTIRTDWWQPDLIGRLQLWALSELARREKAGKAGGRPKGQAVNLDAHLTQAESLSDEKLGFELMPGRGEKEVEKDFDFGA